LAHRQAALLEAANANASAEEQVAAVWQIGECRHQLRRQSAASLKIGYC
jgi:hypothetical protein